MKSKKNYQPTIILCKPQLDENIGAVARAMLNFDFHNLRIIKKDWKPSKLSFDVSAKADKILKNSKIFDNLEDAISDLQYIYATSNRKRILPTKVINLKEGVKIINNYRNCKIGILFGPEKSGLSNEHISLCDKLIEIPLNKNFKSLNLAQSVLLVVYELFNLKPKRSTVVNNKKAKKKELIIFFKVLESYLDNANFFNIKEKKRIMMNNIKAISNKAELNEKEIKIILGIVKNLTK